MQVMPVGIRRSVHGRLVHEAAAPYDRVGTTVGGGLGAPVGATYVVIANDATLTAERALAVSGLLTLLDGGANAVVTIGLAAAAIRPTLTDFTGATGTGPHNLAAAPAVALVIVRTQLLRQVAGAPNPGQYSVAGAGITLGRAVAATDDFWVVWWA